jgi:16S rRNA (guanine966-N2)-methyltransferase
LSSFEKQGISTKIQAHNLDATRYLKSATAGFDLVFVDPPYDFPNSELEQLLLVVADFLSKAGLVIVERSSRSEQLAIQSLALQSSKSYGDTAVWIYEKP